ncbi:DUF6234 family protein [Streptomyces sp. NPDC058459]|uniref:DUF6234 family protein n=1 Tax=Streptomyces sp. NPDC058459 TaxID=3346508 RepID=UPI00365A5CBD
MTAPLPAPRRRFPWSRRTRPGVDLSLAIPLLLLEIGWLTLDAIYGHGLAVWAAQGDRAAADAADLAFMERLRVLQIVVVALAALAALFRARWTVIVHLLVALLVGGALAGVRAEWERGDDSSPGCVRYGPNC